MGFQNRCIRRCSVAFGEHDDISPNDLSPGYTEFGAASDDQRAGAAQIAKAFQDALGSSLLDQRDRDRCRGKPDQDNRVEQLPYHKVDRGSGEQQREHRLAQQIP